MTKIITASVFILLALSAAQTQPLEIKAENAAEILPEVLRLTHCAVGNIVPEKCKAEDFTGAAVDLNGNGSPEFSIANKTVDPDAEKRCTLYRDEKGGMTVIQKEFPCELELAEGSEKGWKNIRGVVYPTGCTPQICDYKWTGAEYKQGACEDYVSEDAACPIEYK